MSGTPFKMKGFSGFGNSPVKQKTQVIAPKKLYGKESILKNHPVTPPETPRKDTLKGQTGFEYDTIPVTNVLNKVRKGVKGYFKQAKKIYIDQPIKTAKKVHKYFTER